MKIRAKYDCQRKKNAALGQGVCMGSGDLWQCLMGWKPKPCSADAFPDADKRTFERCLFALQKGAFGKGKGHLFVRKRCPFVGVDISA